MSVLTDELHKVFDTVRTEADAVLGRIERGVAGHSARLQAILAALVAQAGPHLQQLAGTAIANAFAAAPVASPGAILAAAEAHLTSQLKALKQPFSDIDLPQLKALLLAQYVAQQPKAQDAALNTTMTQPAAIPALGAMVGGPPNKAPG